MPAWQLLLVLAVLVLDQYTSCTAAKNTYKGKVHFKARHHRCRYSFVINEIDPSQCPTMMPQQQHKPLESAGSGVYSKSSTMQQNQPASLASVVWSSSQQAYLDSLQGVQHELQQLEGSLKRQKELTHKLENRLLLHDQRLLKTEHGVQLTWANFTGLTRQLKTMADSVQWQKENQRSLDLKVSGLMLDMTELTAQLAEQTRASSDEDKVGPGGQGYVPGKTRQHKRLSVESAPHLNACEHLPNTTKFRDCEDVYHKGYRRSGIYYITPQLSACPIPVYCDMDTPPGGWLVLQRRLDGSQDFSRHWDEYRRGFGNLNREFWLGNDNIFLLTSQAKYQLRIDLWDFLGSRVFAEYLEFWIGGLRDSYTLHVSNHSGTAPDGLGQHSGSPFSTSDKDNDQWSDYHCAKEWGGGWWYTNCWFAILNGPYYNNTQVQYRGISWNKWKAEQLRASEMKIRPYQGRTD